MKTEEVYLFFMRVFASIIALNCFPYPEEYTGSVLNSLSLQNNEFNTTEKGLKPSDTKECNCGEHSTNCKIDYRGARVCECSKGYGQKVDINNDQTCEKCDCGTNAVLCVISHNGQKICRCKLGNFTDYVITYTDEKCKECDCGPKSVSCEFSDQGKRICKCVKDYAAEKISRDIEDEYCKLCDCGKHGACKVRNGRKDCTCEFGYTEVDGKCIECDCGGKDASNNCKIDTSTGYRKCYCREGYGMTHTMDTDEEYCRRCDCGKFSLSCDWSPTGMKKCTCQEGYVTNDYLDDNDYCKKKSWFQGWTFPLVVILVCVFIGALLGLILRTVRQMRNR